LNESSQMLFESSSTIWDRPNPALATLPAMTDAEIKANVAGTLGNAQKDKKFEGPADLARLISAALKHRAAGSEKGHDGKKIKQTISPQTASNWINGKVIPYWDVLPAIAGVVGVAEDEILFGPRRSDQLRKEREYLTRVSEEEMRLLTIYREASKSGQRTLIKQAKIVAEEHPAPEASLHHLRRKDDKIKT
jgi:hypothetical protein